MTKSATPKGNLATQLHELDKQIQRFVGTILFFVIAIPATYAIWFALIKRSELSDSSASWGTFGDYFGGLLNPLIAFTALYWLTRSVRLQKEELNETRVALEESAIAQRNQVAVASWTALINANTAHTQHLQYMIAQINQAIAAGLPKQGSAIPQQEYEQRISAVRDLTSKLPPIETELHERVTTGKAYEEELKTLAQRLRGDA